MFLVASDSYVTKGGIEVRRTVEPLAPVGTIEPIVEALDERRGVVLASSYEYPGRYTRWDMGFVDPPLEVVARGRSFGVTALNDRGVVLLPAVLRSLEGSEAISRVVCEGESVKGEVAEPAGRLPEEERSRQPTVFSVLRGLIELFASDEDSHLGLYGAFGYDLVFQFEPQDLRLKRPDDQRDLVLYLPDELVLVDHRREVAERRSYEFVTPDGSTEGLDRTGSREVYVGATSVERECDHAPRA
jgi:anthranilate synthase